MFMPALGQGGAASGPSLPGRMEASGAARLQHEFGVTFEPEWKAWFDIFCCELLQAWFEQHAVLEAQMAHVFDAFDKVGNRRVDSPFY